METGRGQERPAAVLLAASCAAALLAGLVMGVVGHGTGPFVAEPWAPDARGVAATAAVGAASFAAMCGVRRWPRPHERDHWAFGERTALAAAGVVAALVVAVHVQPTRFDSIAREDGAVEWISALAAAFACVSLAGTAGRHRGVARLAMSCGAVAMFVVAGEEVSWLQRILDYGTPAALEGNSQSEANLHNMATDAFQIAYYVGVCAVLVLLPHVARWALPARAALHRYLPGPVPVALASLSVVFTYARSGHLAHHVTAWIALATVVLWGARPRAWSLAVATTILLGQLLLVAGGESLARPWAPAEYREMFSALAFAAAALEVSRRPVVEPAHPTRPAGATRLS